MGVDDKGEEGAEVEENEESDETDETEEGGETEELAADDSMDKFTDMLMDQLADKLFDSGDAELDEDELRVVEDYPRDEVEDDQLDEAELAYVLGLRGGKAMKAMKAMVAMKKKAMKKLKASTQKRYAFLGKLSKTKSGLTKADLVKSKSGKIVSKKKQAKGKALYTKYASKWISAVSKARKALGLKGFVVIKKGTPLYTKAKGFYSGKSPRRRRMSKYRRQV